MKKLTKKKKKCGINTRQDSTVSIKNGTSGITLIALVITIIVLLILAAVSIATLTGENGLLTQAQRAKQNTEESALKEELNLKNIESILSQYTGNNDFASLTDKLNVVGINKDTIYQDREVSDVVILEDGKYYNVIVVIANNSINFDMVKQTDGVREEAVILYKIFENDIEDIYCIDEELLEYNGTIYMYTEYQTPDYREVYIENGQEALAKRAIKIKVNTGEDGIVVLPISCYESCTIDWGDGTTTTATKNKEDEENIKIATINNPIKLATSVDNGIEYEYAEKGVDKTVTITGDVEYLGTSLGGVTKDKIIEIEQWGETGLEQVHLSDCKNLTKIALPSKKSFVNVNSFFVGFSGCTSLQSVPEGFFENCPNVTDMDKAFEGCTSLTTAPKVPDSVTNMNSTFEGCTSLTTAPEIPDSVTNMLDTFSGCTSLTTAPEIPNSVTNMNSTFSGCTKLTGDLVINAKNVTELIGCLENASTEPGTDLKLSGSCPQLSDILATKSETSNISLK